MEGMRISELARLTGFAPSTLRYYEREGLLPSPPRTVGGQRLYDAAAVARLRFVRRAKRLGLSLQEVREVLGAWDAAACDVTRQRLQARLRARLAEVRREREALEALERRLATACQALETAPASEGACYEGCGCPPEAAAIASRA